MRLRIKKGWLIIVAITAIAVILVALGWYWFKYRVYNWEDSVLKPPLFSDWPCEDWLGNSSTLYFKFWESFPPPKPNWTIEIIGTETGAVVMVRKFERSNNNNRVTGLMWCWTVEIDRDEWHDFLRSLYNSGIRGWERYYDGNIIELKRCCNSRDIYYVVKSICCERLNNIYNSNWYLELSSATTMYASNSNMNAWGMFKNTIGGFVRKMKHKVIYRNRTPLVYSSGQHKSVPNWEGFQSVIGDFRAKIMQKTDAKLKCEDYEMKNRCVAVCAE